MSNNYVQIDPKDNIIVAITPLQKSMFIDVAGQTFTLNEDIKQKHKFALYDFKVAMPFICMVF
ncbi:altronate dehydratase [Algibacter lectus]|uniref:Altronate dehydratase n=1 Tax=Algibacter lectus TaxID=221126 RepID=A0A090X626_9FLAO|nr:altronate dehydratase [Algibacter lectus]